MHTGSSRDAIEDCQKTFSGLAIRSDRYKNLNILKECLSFRLAYFKMS